MTRAPRTLREFDRPKLWLGVWIFGWLLCISLSLVHPPDLGIDVPDGDKIGHLLSYATLSAWAVSIFARRRAHWLAALALFALGATMEIAQGELTTDRMMDARDAIANTLGILIGQVLGFLPWQTWLQAFERRWLPRSA